MRASAAVPAVVSDCTKFVEKHGIVDGIYRISGVSSQIRLLRYEFDTESRVDLESEVAVRKGAGGGITGISSDGNIICDPHSVAGLCKRYFRFVVVYVSVVLFSRSCLLSLSLAGELQFLKRSHNPRIHLFSCPMFHYKR